MTVQCLRVRLAFAAVAALVTLLAFQPPKNRLSSPRASTVADAAGAVRRCEGRQMVEREWPNRRRQTAKRPAAPPEPALHLGLVRLDMEAECSASSACWPPRLPNRRRQPPETEVYHREANDPARRPRWRRCRRAPHRGPLGRPGRPNTAGRLEATPLADRSTQGGGPVRRPGDAEARLKLFLEVCAVRRQIALANPLLDFNKLLFVKRHQGTSATWWTNTTAIAPSRRRAVCSGRSLRTESRGARRSRRRDSPARAAGRKTTSGRILPLIRPLLRRSDRRLRLDRVRRP